MCGEIWNRAILILGFGVPILFMEDHTFKLIGKVPDLSWVVCRLDTRQQGESSVVGTVGDSRRSLIVANRVRAAWSELSATAGVASSSLPLLAFAQRAWTALRALSLRCAGVSLAALAGPPFLPPFRPRATAAGFFFVKAMFISYVSGQESEIT